MSERRPLSDGEVDGLVRRHLARQEQTVDAAGMLARVRAKPNVQSVARSHRFFSRRRLVALAAAAAVIVVALAGWQMGSAQASPEALVRAAEKTQDTPMDRCYRVTVEMAPGVPDPLGFLGQQRESKLWTRGDRFWMEIAAGPRKGAWGRDEQGRIWATLSPRMGFRFEAEEVPEPVANIYEIRGVHVGNLLRDVLADFELRWEESKPGTVRAIHAEAKPGRNHPALRSVVLEIDPQTKVVQRAVLKRILRGKEMATVTFTLIDTAPPNDAMYHLEEHINRDAQIFSRDRADWNQRRKQFMGGQWNW